MIWGSSKTHNRRVTLLKHVLRNFEEIQNNDFPSFLTTNFGMLASTVNLATYLAQKDLGVFDPGWVDSPSDETPITDIVIGDLEAIFVGYSVIGGHELGEYYYGSYIPDWRLRARHDQGLHPDLVDYSDQVRHFVGGLVIAHNMPGFAQDAAMFVEESEIDDRLFELSFGVIANTNDNNINGLGSAILRTAQNNLIVIPDEILRTPQEMMFYEALRNAANQMKLPPYAEPSGLTPTLGTLFDERR